MADRLLLETGDFLLLETGDKILLEEQAGVAQLRLPFLELTAVGSNLSYARVTQQVREVVVLTRVAARLTQQVREVATITRVPVYLTQQVRETVVPAGPSRGTLIVEKVTEPPGNLAAFTIRVAGGLSPTSLTLHDGESYTYTRVLPQSGYGVAEDAIQGWSTDIVVSNGSPANNISVAAGETVTVTVTNTVVPPCQPPEAPTASGTGEVVVDPTGTAPNATGDTLIPPVFSAPGGSGTKI